MKVQVVPYAMAIDPAMIAQSTVVVIDVLRATSVIVTALANGAREVIPCISRDEALKTAENLRESTYLLCGERDAVKIDGFDLGNSPLEFNPKRIGNKTILLTTTNGTRALHASRDAHKVLIASFLNLAAVVRALQNEAKVTLACSGTQGKFSLDDGMCAAMILDELSKLATVETDDLGQLLLKAYRAGEKDLSQLLKGCFHLNYLLKKGYTEDVNYCLTLNRYDILPIYRNNFIVNDSN